MLSANLVTQFAFEISSCLFVGQSLETKLDWKTARQAEPLRQTCGCSNGVTHSIETVSRVQMVHHYHMLTTPMDCRNVFAPPTARFASFIATPQLSGPGSESVCYASVYSDD